MSKETNTNADSEALTSILESHGVKRGKKSKIIAEVHPDSLEKTEKFPTLEKSILNILNGPKDSIERLAFETNPSFTNQYASLYRIKPIGVPDYLLKRIAIQDDLVSAVLQCRGNHMSSFGRPRPDRHSMGYVIEPRAGVFDNATQEQKEEIRRRIDKASERLKNCGSVENVPQKDKTTLSQWLYVTTRNALTVGRLATEILWTTDSSGEKKFHSFRWIDAGTIMPSTHQRSQAATVRKQARHLLESLKNKKLEPERFSNDEYAWIQVIEGQPRQAFTDDECVVRNFYPVADIEWDGFPCTPIDSAIAAVTTHINITTHNKIYFQSGRATRGMLVIQSDDADEQVVGRVRQQFMAAINSVSNSWRMPVFSVGTKDQITWAPIDTGGRDMEFQYLCDMTSRVLLAAFMISPDELPAFSYLSRGTSSQALSEGNQEYKLTAARDVGLRPLIHHFEDFINSIIFPLIDPSLSKICVVRFMGLDADTPEKESIRVQQDQGVHMTYNEVLDRFEKKPLDKQVGGDVPLNPAYQALIDKYMTVGKIQEYFFGIKGASQDPQWAYVRDPFWFQWQQFQMQAQQMQMAAQQQAQQQAQGGPQGGGGSEPQGGQDSSGQGQPSESGDDSGQGPPHGAAYGQQIQTENQKTEESQAGAPEADLTRSLDQAIDLLSKSEAKLPPSRRRLLNHHKMLVNEFVEGWERDLAEATKEILAVAEKNLPKIGD